jgi:hypothetical protein
MDGKQPRIEYRTQEYLYEGCSIVQRCKWTIGLASIISAALP